jgi:hypothetical protein
MDRRAVPILGWWYTGCESRPIRFTKGIAVRNLILSALLLIPSLALADLAVSVKKAKSSVITETVTTASTIAQVTTEDGDLIGEPVVTPGTPTTTKTSVDKPVAVLIVKTDRPVSDLLIRAKSKTCKPIQIEPGIYTVSEAGSHEVEFMAIGQNPLSWDEATVVVAVNPGPGPTPPGPGPSPTPPGPDDGSFDKIATRVSVIARQLGQVQRNQIAGVFLSAADQMQSFQFKQGKQASDYIARNWPPCESPACGELYRLIAADAKPRLLSWQETQAYYRAIAKGVLQ